MKVVPNRERQITSHLSVLQIIITPTGPFIAQASADSPALLSSLSPSETAKIIFY